MCNPHMQVKYAWKLFLYNYVFKIFFMGKNLGLDSDG